MEEKGGTEATPLVGTQPRNRSYVSWFDVIAGPGAAFLMLLTVTSLVPTAEHTAHHAAHGGAVDSAEDHVGKAAAQQSGILLGVVALGICLSNAWLMSWPDERLDSRKPFLLAATMLIAGSSLFAVGTLCELSIGVLYAARAIAALGFGAGFAAKRRYSMDEEPRRRELFFMLHELTSSLGIACGPLFVGCLGLLLPSGTRGVAWAASAPLLVLALSVAYLALVLLLPLDTPFQRDGELQPRQSPPPPQPSQQPHEQEEEQQQSKGDSSPLPPEPPTVTETAVVQVTCLSFGVTRLFLKFDFESAMVIIYATQLGFSESIAAILAGCLALSALATIFAYNYCCVTLRARADAEDTLLALAESFGFLSAGLLILCAAFPIATYGTAPSIALTLGASFVFYPSMYLSGALGNAHALRYAQPGHPLLSKAAMVGQQEVVGFPIGSGLGLLVCRVAFPGRQLTPPSIGELFLGVMSVQFVFLAIGWDWRKTKQRWRRWRRATC